MKKHELIKHAYDNYPKGTKVKTLYDGEVRESSGVFVFSTNIWCNVGDLTKDFDIYDAGSGSWAEIVNPKIAVKVENEKEFHALMKYYDGLGWKWRMGQKATEHTPEDSFPLCIGIENGNKIMIYIGEFKEFERIHFTDFAKEHNIKLPLIKSEDGVWLYEGCYCYVSVCRANKWLLDDHTDGGDSERFEVTDNGKFINSETEKHFSNKQAALDWIEAQKPKETILFEGSSCYVKVDENGFKAVAESDERTFIFSGEELKQIYNAWQEHQPF